ncbi:hypothetical protein J6590_019391 [Homalodisca vitripennis]|nr:hypothetical protein J6590_019391 [Homalodisca vitripennis]
MLPCSVCSKSDGRYAIVISGDNEIVASTKAYCFIHAQLIIVQIVFGGVLNCKCDEKRRAQLRAKPGQWLTDRPPVCGWAGPTSILTHSVAHFFKARCRQSVGLIHAQAHSRARVCATGPVCCKSNPGVHGQELRERVHPVRPVALPQRRRLQADRQSQLRVSMRYRYCTSPFTFHCFPPLYGSPDVTVRVRYGHQFHAVLSVVTAAKPQTPLRDMLCRPPITTRPPPLHRRSRTRYTVLMFYGVTIFHTTSITLRLILSDIRTTSDAKSCKDNNRLLPKKRSPHHLYNTSFKIDFLSVVKFISYIRNGIRVDRSCALREQHRLDHHLWYMYDSRRSVSTFGKSASAKERLVNKE